MLEISKESHLSKVFKFYDHWHSFSKQTKQKSYICYVQAVSLKASFKAIRFSQLYPSRARCILSILRITKLAFKYVVENLHMHIH